MEERRYQKMKEQELYGDDEPYQTARDEEEIEQAQIESL